MSKARLDPKLLKKLGERTNHKEKYLREQISKKASRGNISSEAVLILWAKKEEIGTAVYQRKLPADIRAEVRDFLPSIFAVGQKTRVQKEKVKLEKKSSLSLAIEYLIQDEELYDRCGDLIRARRNFDRVFREATTVLEDRIKRLSNVKGMRPVDLVGKVLNPDPIKAILKVSEEKFEQEGFFSICKGLMLSFRATTHHELSDKFSREDALKFCGFVDSLLSILGQASKQKNDKK